MPREPLTPGDYVEVVTHIHGRRHIVDGVLISLAHRQAVVRLLDGRLHKTAAFHVQWAPSPDAIRQATLAMQATWSHGDERMRRGATRYDPGLGPTECNVRDVCSGMDGRRIVVMPRD